MPEQAALLSQIRQAKAKGNDHFRAGRVSAARAEYEGALAAADAARSVDPAGELDHEVNQEVRFIRILRIRRAYITFQPCPDRFRAARHMIALPCIISSNRRPARGTWPGSGTTRLRFIWIRRIRLEYITFQPCPERF